MKELEHEYRSTCLDGHQLSSKSLDEEASLGEGGYSLPAKNVIDFCTAHCKGSCSNEPLKPIEDPQLW